MNGSIFVEMAGHVIGLEYTSLEDLRAKVSYINDNPQQFTPLKQFILDTVAGAVVVNLPEVISSSPGAPGVPPLCPTHRVEMVPSTKKPGTFYCTQKDSRGRYCRETSE